MIGIAYALGAGGGSGAGQGGGGFGAFVPLLLMFAIFYFLLIRPQQKRSKQQREMIDSLKKGDRIITSGGIHARITGVADTTLTIEIADKVRVKINRSNVGGLVTPATAAPPVKKAPDNSKKK